MNTDTYCSNEIKIGQPKYYQPQCRLYLSTDSQNEVYVDNYQIISHQKDGIRFLFKQYNKSNPGVIVNDPTGYGKRLQIVLFICAIKHLLTKPVMIFCSEDELKNWIEHFQMWTNFSNELVVNSSNPFIKKTVFINSMSTWSTVSRGNWSVFVVDFAEIIPKSLDAIKVGYKIWITNENMRVNLEKFEKIYKWINPKDKFDFKEFINETTNIDHVTRVIIIDCFQENVLLRRTDFKGPLFKKLKKSHTKDITGTKIKRSRTRVVNTDEPPAKVTRNIEISNVTEAENYAFDTEININYEVKNILETEIGEMDVEKFIRDQKPINAKDLKINSPESEDPQITNPNTSNDEKEPKDFNDDESSNIMELDNNYYDKSDSKNIILEEACDKSVDISDVKSEITELNETKPIENINTNKYMESELEISDDTLKKANEIQSEANVKPNNTKPTDQSETKTFINKSEGVKSDVKEEKINKVDVDSELNYLNEMLLKKFKGSLLDKLF